MGGLGTGEEEGEEEGRHGWGEINNIYMREELRLRCSKWREDHEIGGK